MLTVQVLGRVTPEIWGRLELFLNITADSDVLLESFKKFTAATRTTNPCDDDQALESPEGTAELGGRKHASQS